MHTYTQIQALGATYPADRRKEAYTDVLEFAENIKCKDVDVESAGGAPTLAAEIDFNTCRIYDIRMYSRKASHVYEFTHLSP